MDIVEALILNIVLYWKQKMLRVESRLWEVPRLNTVNTGEAVSVDLGHCLRHLHQLGFFLFLIPLGRQPYTWKVEVAQSCLTLCNYGLYSLWNSPGQNTGVGSLSFLQGIIPTQGSNAGLLHCRWISYWLSHKGSPYKWRFSLSVSMFLQKG